MAQGVPVAARPEGVKERRDEGVNGTNGAMRRQGYQDLVAWQKGMDLVLAVYSATRVWPREELFGLTSQVRRAAVAIPSNLAEGHGRTGRREFAHHASIAYGSLCELETQLMIAEQLGYGSSQGIEHMMVLIADVRRLTRGLMRSLEVSTNPGELR
jgi:four helix bundle protein